MKKKSRKFWLVVITILILILILILIGIIGFVYFVEKQRYIPTIIDTPISPQFYATV